MQDIFLINFLVRIWQHFKEQNCLRMATALSYQTLLAIVPIAAVAFALFTAVPAFNHLKEKLTNLLFDNLLPSKFTAIDATMHDFTLNAGQMIYIVITLMGPIALGSSLTLVNWIISISEEATGFQLSGALGLLSTTMPMLLPFIILFILYRIVPACDVKWRHAFIGAATATVLFLLGKYLFKLYLEFFPSYEVVYGAMAAFPLFLIWLYVSWAIVLFGASIAAVLGFEYTGEMEKR